MSTPRGRNVDSETTKPRLGSSTRAGSVRQADQIGAAGDPEIEELAHLSHLQVFDDSVRDPNSSRDVKKPSPAQISRTSAQRPAIVSNTARATVQDDHRTQDVLGNKSVPAMSIVMAAVHLPISSVRNEQVSTFLPNCWNMFALLHEMHLLTMNNTYLFRTSPSYCTISSRLYYGVLWFVQVLRAKYVCSRLTAVESSFLRSFERAYPLESLVIAGPLVEYFRGLGAFRSDDPLYTWISPEIPEVLGPAQASLGLKIGKSLMYPSIPGMISLLEKILNCTNLDNSANANMEFIPFNLVNGGTFCGFVSQPQANALLLNEMKEILDLPGINQAPEQYPDVLKQIQVPLKRSIRLPQILGDTPLSNIRQFLCMDRMDWFAPFVTLAAAEANFFHGSSNMNEIPATCGFETLFTGETSIPSVPSARPTDWYPGLRVPSAATYTTTRGKSTEADLRTGITNGIIRNVPSNIDGHSPSGTVNSGCLTGPYWANQVYQFETPIDVSPQIHFGFHVSNVFFIPKGGRQTIT